MTIQGNKLTGMLLYTSIQEPQDCFDKAKGREWKVSVVVDEDTADAFEAQFPKQAAKKIKRAEFEKKFGVQPPEGDDKNLFIITLRRNTMINDKENKGQKKPVPPQYRPKLFQRQGATLVDITNDFLVANGSMGQVSFDVMDNSEYGPSARLKNVLVTTLIPYEKGSSDPGSEFDEEDSGAEQEVKKPAAKTRKAVAAEPEADAPF